VLVGERNSYRAVDGAVPRRGEDVRKWWLWPNLLSLDAPLVAVLWQALFVCCFHGKLAATTGGLLVASVWLIYTADRALDVWRGECSSVRHRFYQAHWRTFFPLWIAVLLASGWLAAIQLPAGLRWRGLALLAAVLAYLFAVHGGSAASQAGRTSAVTSKEASVGLLFALGVSLAAWNNVRTWTDAGAIGLFFVLCWINCAAIQKWESASWNGGADWPVRSASVAVALVAGVVLWMHRPILGGAEMASAIAFVWLDRWERRLSPEALRVLADAALLSPLLFLPFAGRA
jgi:hypothetical protein